MKKVLCILLTALMTACAVLMASCAESPYAESGTISGETDTAAVTGPEETEIKDDLPDINFKDKTFRVILQEDSAGDIYTEDHETGEPIHDAVFERNIKVCERFGVKLEISKNEYTAVNNAISRSVKAGSDDYDLCFVHMVSGASLAQSNLVMPFHNLPYVDLEKPWWDKDIRNGFSIRNNLMMVNGDISPRSFSLTSCLYFNKTLFDKYDLQYPYDLVRSGDWTLDKLYELTKGMTRDNDGDGTVTKTSTSDIYCLTSWYLDVPYSFYYAAGGMLVSKDQDDVPFYDPQLERDSVIYSKIYNVIIGNNSYFESSMSDYMRVIETFLEGRALFYDSTLAASGTLRDMDDEFGILPVPKLDTVQSDYRSFVNGASSMICVPATVPAANREFVSVIIEALASEAYRTVTPVLKENYLKRKVTRDADSADMIDYIVRNRVFDMAYVNMHDGVGSYVRDLLQKGSADISAELEKYQKSAAKKISNIVKAFDKSLKS